jgi:uncharacterized membrane protein YukC
MTGKIYKSAQGKTVDLGALILQNEDVRAVGNMGVNARGDLLDSNNRVIDKKNHQIKRHTDRQTRSIQDERKVHTSTLEARRALRAERAEKSVSPKTTHQESVEPTQPLSGLEAAMARSRGDSQ